MSLAGVAQVIRLHRHTQYVRQGKVYKETDDTVFAVTSFTPEEAGPQALLQLARDHWSIENGQHHRRDRTQDEDRCMVGATVAARNLSLFRSLSIFLLQHQCHRNTGKPSLPDFESHNHSHPWVLIHYFTDQLQT